MSRRGSIWTPANIVTVLRVVLVPIWLATAEFSVNADGLGISVSAMLVAVFYILISLTDKLDGYLARSRNEVTAFGQFLDPIADKLAVVVALCFLLEHGMTSAWVLLVIVAREFLVSGLRMVVAEKGVVVPASNLGKWKTAVTMVAICGILVVRALPAAWPAIGPVRTCLDALMIVAVILTIWSGVDYFKSCWPYVAETS